MTSHLMSNTCTLVGMFSCNIGGIILYGYIATAANECKHTNTIIIL